MQATPPATQVGDCQWPVHVLLVKDLGSNPKPPHPVRLVVVLSAPLGVLLAQQIVQRDVGSRRVGAVLQGVGEGQTHGLYACVQVPRAAPLALPQARVALDVVERHERRHTLRFLLDLTTRQHRWQLKAGTPGTAVHLTPCLEGYSGMQAAYSKIAGTAAHAVSESIIMHAGGIQWEHTQDYFIQWQVVC